MALLEENIKHTESLMASALDEVFLEIDKKYWVELKTISVLQFTKAFLAKGWSRSEI